MNPGMVGVFIPVIAMLGVFSLLLARSPLGQALADRLRHGPTPRGGSGEENAELLENEGAWLFIVVSTTSTNLPAE